MPTLVAVFNADGRVGRCDAKCYAAQSAECECICGGKNHGAGLERARANTAELGDELLEQWAKLHGFDARELRLGAQSDLFPFGNEPTTKELRRLARRRARDAAEQTE